ncbi:MAG: hypothetical protein KAG18_06770 [Sinobacterium sp.]|nr:hypothetical protein [Sinobacterium sp.]
MTNDNNTDDSAFDDILFSSDEELAQRKDEEPSKPDSTPKIMKANADVVEEAFTLEPVIAEPPAVVKAPKKDKPVRAAPKIDMEDEYADVVIVDALFENEDALESALDAETVIKPKKKKAPKPLETDEIVFDFEPYLHGDENARSLQALAATAPGLALANKRLNTSLVANVDWEVPETLDEELLEDIARAAQEKLDKQEDERRIAAQKPATKKAFLKQIYSGSKAKVEGYLGRTLPEREIALNFKFPPYVAAKESEVLLTGNQVTEIFAKKKETLLTIFKKSSRALDTITSRELSAAKQEHLLSAIYVPLVEKTYVYLASVYKLPEVPALDIRKELENLCLLSIKQAILAYKQLYALYYESNNITYALKREEANQAAWRLMELLCLEQRLNTALYRPHINSSSATFNKVYNVLVEYENDFILQEQPSLVFNEIMNAQTLFMRFQIEQAFDITGISATAHKNLRSYWFWRSELILSLTQEQLSSAWVDACWIIGHEHDGRAIFDESIELQQLPASYLHVEPFLQQIQKDYACAIDLLRKNPLHELPKLLDIDAFEFLSGGEVLQILGVLNQQIISIEKNLRLPKFSMYKKFTCEVNVLSGVSKASAFMTKSYSDKADGRFKAPTAKSDDSVISEKKEKRISEGFWDVAMEDEKSICMQATETVSCPSMNVGDLIVLIKSLEVSAEVKARNALACEEVIPIRIVSLERGANNRFALTGEKLGGNSVAVTIKNAQAEEQPAIVSIQNGQRQLIMDTQWSLCSGDKVTMKLFDGTQTDICIAALLSISNKIQAFSIYEL